MNYDFLKDIPGAIPKPEPRCVTKKRRDKVDAKDERACRDLVRKRDKGKCRIPGCLERATEAHHIVYRSKSKARRWDPANLVSLYRAPSTAACRRDFHLRQCGRGNHRDRRYRPLEVQAMTRWLQFWIFRPLPHSQKLAQLRALMED